MRLVKLRKGIVARSPRDDLSNRLLELRSEATRHLPSRYLEVRRWAGRWQEAILGNVCGFLVTLIADLRSVIVTRRAT
jgi:hypothetical protein